MHNLYKGILLIFILFCSNISIAFNQIIEINKGTANPLPIAINNFSTEYSSNKTMVSNIMEVVTNDLRNSGMFRIVAREAFIEKKIGINHIPSYASWRAIGASVLLNGEIRKLASDRYEINFILWDNLLNKQIVGQSFEINDKLWRRVAHKIADKIYSSITGQSGYFDTRIAYISETIVKKKKIKRLAIMDYDGKNNQFLTDGKYLVLTPRLSPDGNKILYISYERRIPKVFILDLRTGQRRLVGHFSGISYAPHFSPDGKKAVMSIAKNGFSNIYEVDMQSFVMKKLTNNFAINTSPCYSPDGSKIVYNSDISGSRHLYVMNANGSNPIRISFGDGAYASPVWSPRGDLIAFTRVTRSQGFVISVMQPDGSNERIITKGYIVEGPTWAPNGSVIAYTKYTYPIKGKDYLPSIHSIDIAGYNDMKITTLHGASAPEWSKLLK